MAKTNNELMAIVERDVDAYIKTLRDVDPGANDESYRHLHDRLCSMIYEMRAAGRQESSRSLGALSA